MNKAAKVSWIWLGAFLWMASSPVLGDEIRHDIDFPDLPGYQTLQCDMHMHTVFSDGQVWPPVRVAEAWRQGLDVIAITDHIEVQPHKSDVPTNHNRPYDLAVGQATAHGLLLIKATEITRSTPPGHFNTLFLDDIEPLDTEDFLEAIKQANEQNAFVVWNHQAWKGEENGRWLEVHSTMFDNKWFHGMEICNHDSYYPTAHEWCLEKGLTMLGNSDIHAPDLRKETVSDDHRTMTFVFAKERTLPAIKEALQEGRTAVWYKDRIIGRTQWLKPLFDACVEVGPPNVRSGRTAWVPIRNLCEADIQLVRTGNLGPTELSLPAQATTLVKIATSKPDTPLELKYTATNFLVAPETGLPVVLNAEPVEE